MTELLEYIERDESRHVALGVLHLQTLLGRTTRLERLRNWRFNLELFLLSIAGGELLDPHLARLGIERGLGAPSPRPYGRGSPPAQMIHRAIP